jgi:hypothetical protein
MADITMCKGTGCARAELCYRHTAVVNELRQSYFMTIPVLSSGDCPEYTPNDKAKALSRYASKSCEAALSR